MAMRCISVYTKDFEMFSNIYEEIINTPLSENEEKEIEGITISDSGEVPAEYIEKMRQKPEVAVMSEKKSGILIMQHGEVFEVLIPVEV
jgi:hypothetical protein